MTVELNVQVKLVDRKRALTQQPTVDGQPYRIAVIGACPNDERDENNNISPFAGRTGDMLTSLMSNAGILRSACLMGSLCQYVPPAGELHRWDWNCEEIQTSLKTLTNELFHFKPNIVILVGQTALRNAKGKAVDISDWRGSLFICDAPSSPFFGLKCIATHTVNEIFVQWNLMSLVVHDLRRARDQGASKELRLPQRTIEIDLSCAEIVKRLDNWPVNSRCSLDIEGVLPERANENYGAWTMISLAYNPYHGFCIAWSDFTLEEEIKIMVALSRLLYREDVGKVLQNSLYDAFVLAYGYKILVRNIIEDTMLKGWEIYSELPKSLGLQASIWTLEPCYKTDVAHTKAEKKRRTEAGIKSDERVKKIYCVRDSLVTEEIALAQDKALSSDAMRHYRFNVNLLPTLLYMELRGHLYDKSSALNEHAICCLKIQEAKTRLALHTGSHQLFGPSGAFSSQRLCVFLYDIKGFTRQFKKEKGRLTEKLTSDTEALLQLSKKFDDQVLHEILRIKQLLKVKQYLEVETDPDGRARCGYNIVGTETGRMSCYKSPTGSGTNLTTIAKKLRHLYRADTASTLHLT